MNETEALEFFVVQTQAFTETLASQRGCQGLIDSLLSQAFSSFDGNVALDAAGLPEIACRKGCATCCTLRVTATAPEILLIVRYIRWTGLADSRLNLTKRVIKADQSTRGMDETQRVKLKRPCPFIMRGVCAIYPVRPLACRGHACYDKHACLEAAAGKVGRIPISEPHSLFRSLIQNAMQSALRDAGYAWASYELIQSVKIGLDGEHCAASWLRGEDVFASARIEDVSLEEMGHTFDRIKLQSL
ncbi:MAG: YkgJ family cysteine cluster protein [Methylococcales bacterium]|nr:YkgJ family cysteine cluster protein [Methylococcales bacterium]